MKKKEILIIAMILVVSLLGFAYIYLTQQDKTMAVVKDIESDQVLLEFDVNKDAIYELDVKYGKFHIEVKDGHYHAFDVDCPNQTCVNFGWMPSLGIYEAITCIPNGLMIMVK